MVTPNHQNTSRPGHYHPARSGTVIPNVRLKLCKLPSHMKLQRSWILPRATVSKAFCTSWSLAPCLDRDQPPYMTPGLGASPEKVPAPQHWCPWVAATITEQGICTSHSCTASNNPYKTTVLAMRLANWEKHIHSKLSVWLTVLLQPRWKHLILSLQHFSSKQKDIVGSVK